MDKKVLYHTKYTDTGQPTEPKSFVIVVERTVKSNRYATTAYSDLQDTVGRSRKTRINLLMTNYMKQVRPIPPACKDVDYSP